MNKSKHFYSLTTPRDVAELLEVVDYGKLVYHLYKVPDSEKYKVFTIPKKSGGEREITSPVTALKIIQQKLNEVLLNVYKPKPSVFSYVRKRSIVDNASKHKRQRYVFNIDLEDFFPSINFGRVRGLFIGKPYYIPPEAATVIAQICCHNNQLPQGAPTSPIVSNMICAQMDSQLQALAMRHKCYYTRYADDMTFSTSIRDFPSAIATMISLTEVEVGGELDAIIESNGFRINKSKVRLQPRYRRQEVTGLTVNEFPNVRRNYVRQIRAMLYAWKEFGIADAEKDYFTKYDDKYRNPELELPSFRLIVKGKIEFLGMVRGEKNPIYRRFIEKYKDLHSRDKGVPRLTRTILEGANKPIVYVEVWMIV